MYNFILQTAIMLSLGLMIYLMARAVPRISDDLHKPVGRFHQWLGSLRLEKVDNMLSNSLEKFLRKAKLFLMKMDNIANEYLDKIKKAKPNANSQKTEEEKPTLFNNNSETGGKGGSVEE